MYLIADTHNNDIDCQTDILIVLGDFVSGQITGAKTKILVRGNKDTTESEKDFDFVCDSIRLGEYYLTHEPQERLPRGSAYNVHGHLHYGLYEDYGYKQKEFHIRLKPNKLYSLEELSREGIK